MKSSTFERGFVFSGRGARFLGFLTMIGYTLLASHAAHADATTSVVRVSCIPELGQVEIETTFLRGERALATLESRRDLVARKYGYYEIASLLSIREVADAPGGRVITDRQRTRIECALATESVEISFEPAFAVPCSGAFTVALTVRIGGQTVVNDLVFDETCLDEDFLRSFSYTEQSEFFVLEGIAGTSIGPNFFLRQAVDLEASRGRPISKFSDVVTLWKQSRGR
ncbi:MAG: hypothetical protein IID55_12385 [Proteobacteria bacterium]|nr:hypothetical protein [Pseudomonadota bacterium]